jgi:regulatory protein
VHDREGDARDSAMAAAGRALAQRDRSRAELARRLASTAPPEIVTEVVGDLERMGYLDDARLAASLAARRLEAGWGSLRIAADLERLGVEAADAVVLAARGEHAAASALLASRHARGRTLAQRFGLLARRGFLPETIEDVLGSEVVDA